MIERAAVVGKVFHRGAVATLSPRAARADGDRPPALARAQGADPAGRPSCAGEDAFRFRHLLIRDAAYEASRRAARRAARTFRRLAGGEAGDRVAPSTRRSSATTSSRPSATGASWAGPRPHESARQRRRGTADPICRSSFSATVAISSSARPLPSNAPPKCPTATFAPGRSSSSRGSSSTSTTSRAASRPPGRRSRWPRRTGSVSALRARLIYVEGLGQIDPSYTLEGTRSESRAALAELERLGDAGGSNRRSSQWPAPTSTPGTAVLATPSRKSYEALPQGSLSSIGR